MSKGKVLACAVAAMLAASATLGQEKERDGVKAGAAEKAATGWIERGFARLERAIERLEAKLSGRERGGMMDGCEDMMAGGGMMEGGMMGGGMMGGSRPNERWRGSVDGR